jgi:hypothetical protein
MMNKWEKLKWYVNRKQKGAVFSRKNLLFLIYKDPKYRTSSYGTTADIYLRCLIILGIIERIDRGMYQVVHHIKKDLSSSELKKIAYGGYRRWFNDVKEEAHY